MEPTIILDDEFNLKHNNSCLIFDCVSFPDIHHVMSRGSGAGDHKSNCVNLCRMHHTEIHKKGRSTFAEHHPEFEEWLTESGWDFIEYVDDLTGKLYKKWFLPNKLLGEVLRS